MMPLILTSFENSVATITMNNLRRHNALSEPLIEEIIDALHRFREKKARAVVLRAPEGVKVWSAGHDVKELPLSRRDPLGWDDPLRMVVREIETFPAPVIARSKRVWKRFRTPHAISSARSRKTPAI